MSHLYFWSSLWNKVTVDPLYESNTEGQQIIKDRLNSLLSIFERNLSVEINNQ